MIILLGLGALALVLATAAAAGTVTATATLTGAGSLALTNGATASFSDVLDGTDQSVTYTLPLTLNDLRASGAGWNLTMTSTAFTNGTRTLATNASSISSATSACIAGGTCLNPTNSIGYPLTIPAAATAPAPVKFFNAALFTGLGRFTITPTINVSIPGNSYLGTYTSTLTIAAISGP
jgi:hypothetical protein